MDKVMKITLGLFFIILAAFIGMLAYNGYVDTAYRTTITGTYTYTCNITTDSPLYNVTLFIPVPADRDGNSPVVSALSSRVVSGIPEGWDTILYDTGKSTMVKVMTPAIVPPAGTSASNPYTISISYESRSGSPVDTRNPGEKSAVFRPMQDVREKTCVISTGITVPCSLFTTTIYADYRARPDARVKITSSVTGRNTWTIFEPQSNEFHSEVSLGLTGENHGWANAEGQLATGIGTYAGPAGS
ncbi:MAG: hypothetical protein LUQ19_00805 [Methanoregula sp.]|nr:hypothetical protein [Methanoregula sp.]